MSFRFLLSVINEYLEGYTTLTDTEIKKRSQDSYEGDELMVLNMII